MKNLDLATIAVIDAIERRGSFAKAAEELGRVPSSVTYAVRNLEDELGVLLFDRSGHRARLTSAGEEFLAEGRQLLQGADALERRVRRLATGWEVELRIAVDGLICMAAVLDLVGEFLDTAPATRLRISSEVLGGTWDALSCGRADLALGTLSERAPAGDSSGFEGRLLGNVEMVFAVTPDHPLAALPEPLTRAQVRSHRAVAVADSARNQPATTVGLLLGQDVLTVASLTDKLAAQLAGLGCGYLPRGMIAAEVAAGRLVIKATRDSMGPRPLYYAWNSSARGKAMSWFFGRLEDPVVRARLLPHSPGW